MKRTYKPNFVFPITRDGNHSSSPDVTIGIERSTRKCRNGFPSPSAGRQ